MVHSAIVKQAQGVLYGGTKLELYTLAARGELHAIKEG